AEAAGLDLKPGAYVAITVEDSGVGMGADVLKRVFEPFFTTKGGQGTGLGLSQVYGFARQSGGTVTLQSTPGRGTTACIYLPRAEPSVAERECDDGPMVAPVAVPRAEKGDTILVVEDDEDVRAYTAGLLRELGYAVLEAMDAPRALQIVEREAGVRLLLTDLGLPGGLDGR